MTFTGRRSLPGLLSLCLLTAPAQTPAGASQPLTLSGEYHGIHDPSIIREKGTYYVFAPGAIVPPG